MPKVLNLYHQKNKAVPDGAVYVGRPSKWGNPFMVGRDGERGECVGKFEDYLENNDTLRQDLHELKDKDLVCFCAPARCHADILLREANK
jgi:hypothetical protein